MQLKNDLSGQNGLDVVISGYYKKAGRYARKFLTSENKDWNWVYLHYIVDRKHVIRYGIGEDRGFWLGGVELSIGAAYFGAADFWDYKNHERFSIEASTEAVEKNLGLLDEFWGNASLF